jgi:hypothetical protein
MARLSSRRRGSSGRCRRFAPVGAVVDDQPRAALAGAVGPGPAGEDCQLVAELDQVLDVHKAPGELRQASGEAQAPRLEDSERPADSGHAAAVAIVKRWGRRSAAPSAPQELGDVAPLLEGDLRNSGQWPAVLDKVGGVAEDEDLRVAGHAAIGGNVHAPGAIGLDAEPGGGGGGLDASGPDYRARPQPMTTRGGAVVAGCDAGLIGASCRFLARGC